MKNKELHQQQSNQWIMSFWFLKLGTGLLVLALQKYSKSITSSSVQELLGEGPTRHH